MPHSRRTVVAAGSIVGMAALALVCTGWIMPSWSMAAERVLPGQPESRIASNGMADDHLAAALLYQKEAQQAQIEVNKYTRAAASIKPIEDPKGFRRSALMTAAQTQQRYAGEMQQLHAAHQAKAETMMGKQQPQ